MFMTIYIFNNTLMFCHWATISQEYSDIGILKELVYGERNSIRENVNELGEKLYKKLSGRRYLIILDDMWSVEAWDEVRMFLPDNENGSRVIVTTRLSNLAINLSPSPFKMNFLDEDESWKLFCGKAFEEDKWSVELEGIGRRIVKRCGGLPLSIVVIGSHLRKSGRASEYWEKVASSMNPIWSLDENCMNIVRLSYQQLPVRLKPCFLYFGIFLEDEKIDVDNFVKLWVAEGFVKPKEAMSLEEVAEDYLDDLIDRNLVIVHGKRRWNGKPHLCGIHDIVRELCLKVCEKEKFACVLDTTHALLWGRRIIIPSGKRYSDINNAQKSAPLVRSLINFNSFDPDDLSVELRLLRVSFSVMVNLCSPEVDTQQVNLRDFRPSDVLHIGILTWSISLFWNLQTINMSGYDTLPGVPLEIWELAQLRHLECSDINLPDPLPDDLQEGIILQNLQTLSGVHDFRLTEEVCKRMPNIKELFIQYNGKTCSECYPYNLGRFNKLESVELYQCDSIQSFTFPITLQELYLSSSSVDWEDFGIIIKSLPHIGYLSLGEFKGEEWSLAVDDEFSRLKCLMISSCDDLIFWNANSSNFPVLETLYMDNLPKLSEIPFDIGDTPSLAYIKVTNCRVSAAVSAMRIVVEQENCGNENLQLRVHLKNKEEVERFQILVEEDYLKTMSLHLFCDNRRTF